jgi:flagella basal body P-ring formation protein FlgA
MDGVNLHITRVLLILLLGFGFCGTAGALEISMKHTSEVNDSVIRLGDVANFDEKSQLSEALATLTVGSAPPPGESIVFRAKSIQQALLASKAVPEDITWSGSPAVTVNRQGATVGPEQIMSFIAGYIRDQKKNLPEAEVKFVPEALPLPFQVPVGDLAVEVIPANPGILGSSRFSLIFRIGNQVVKNMSVRGKVEAIARVVVTSESLQKGTILKAESLTTAPTDISELAAPQYDPAELVGMKLNRSLRAGIPVLAGMVETLPVVHRGDKVKIVLNSGAMHVTATGVAAADGRITDMIRVQNISSNKLIYCRVNAPGLVEVLL